MSLAVFAGLRPLAAPAKEGQSTKEVSRSHKIIVSHTGLITVIGGKWTTFRKIAQDIIDRAIVNGHLDKKPCVTQQLSIHGTKRQLPQIGTIIFTYMGQIVPKSFNYKIANRS